MEVGSVPAEAQGNGNDPSQQGGEEQAADQGVNLGFIDISSVPEDYRPHVAPIFKDIEREIGTRLQDAAEYRKGWEPYESLGLDQYEPESLGQVLQFANEVLGNDESFEQWWNQVGEEQGWFESDGDEGDDDEDDEGLIDLSDPDTFRSAIREEIGDVLSPILESQRNDEQQRAVEEAGKQIEQQVADLKGEYGEFDEQVLYKFASHYDGPEAIQKGFQDMMEFVNSVEGQIIEGSGGGAPRPEGPGQPNTSPEPIRSIKDARKVAQERIRASRQS